METEFWAHYYAENAGRGEEYEDDDFDAQAILASLAGGGDDEWEDVINDRS